MQPDEPRLIRAHAHFFADDLTWIAEHYGDTIGMAKFMRIAVHDRIETLRRMLKRHEPLPDLDDES